MPEELKPKFDMTVRLDHLITLVVVILVLVMDWNPRMAALDKRIALSEQQLARQQQTDAAQDQRLQEAVAQINLSLRRIEDKLDAVRK